MDYRISFERHPEYLHATITGANTAENVAGYLSDIIDECRRTECYRILVDEQLTGPRLEASDVFEIASTGAIKALGIFQAVAYVDPQMGDMADFAETVAINRGMPVKIFTSVEQARKWLLRQEEGPGEQQIFHGEESEG